MLLAATAIFLYYTAWTLLMVTLPLCLLDLRAPINNLVAICRPGPPPP